ncbi:hypothetical protein [Sphingobium mellinum]|uniref:hypothetical protein n=1 Tax=Sphingobium mellinum TaxID=1387166 RepID=UPI0030EC1AE4
MDRIDHVFAALSQRMKGLTVPERAVSQPQSLASLIDKVNSAKRLYEGGHMRR